MNFIEIGSLIILVILISFWFYYYKRLLKAKKEHERLVKKTQKLQDTRSDEMKNFEIQLEKHS